MRGRTNIVQRVGALVNGDVIEATVEDGNSVAMGDFVEYKSRSASDTITLASTSIVGVLKYGSRLVYLSNGVVYLYDVIERQLLSSYGSVKVKDIGKLNENVVVCISEDNTAVIVRIENNRLNDTGMSINVTPELISDDAVSGKDVIYTYVMVAGSGSDKFCLIYNETQNYYSASQIRQGLRQSNVLFFSIVGSSIEYEGEILVDTGISKTYSTNTLALYHIYSDAYNYVVDGGYIFFFDVEDASKEETFYRFNVDFSSMSVIVNTINYSARYDTLNNSVYYKSGVIRYGKYALYAIGYLSSTGATSSSTQLKVIDLENNLEISSTAVGMSNNYIISNFFKTDLFVLYYFNNSSSSAASSTVAYNNVYRFNSDTGTIEKTGTEYVDSLKYRQMYVPYVLEDIYIRIYDNQIVYAEILGESIAGALDKNTVKKYAGGNAIGFAKTSGKSGEKIQIYIPKKEDG